MPPPETFGKCCELYYASITSEEEGRRLFIAKHNIEPQFAIQWEKWLYVGPVPDTLTRATVLSRSTPL